ncbi:hypothetical protein NDU88_001219 [Pleurodeles waltl]|uniref:Uncharacterized protein n=1 Tax=Pleurodeles waltl TaxID=8319 RepID=A0AAV7SZA6_PLEWA|nr:hypothetical protein NDU88_001219 [Pleurodeles waltl]
MENAGSTIPDAIFSVPVSPPTVINKALSKLPVTVPTSSNKRAKNDPPSPLKAVDTISTELLLEEIRVIKPYMEDTNKQLQLSDDKLSLVENRVFRVERRVEVLEDSVTVIQSLQSEFTMLQRHAEVIENRNRRNNLRIYCLPEGIEGSDSLSFFQAFLPNILDIPTSPVLNIQRVHRHGHPSPLASTSKKPRGIIVNFWEYVDLLKVLRAAKAKGRITWSGSNLFFTQVYAKSTAGKQNKFLGMPLALKLLNARYGLFHPCLLKVTYNNKTTTYEDPVLLQQFIESCGGDTMDTSKISET